MINKAAKVVFLMIYTTKSDKYMTKSLIIYFGLKKNLSHFDEFRTLTPHIMSPNQFKNAKSYFSAALN